MKNSSKNFTLLMSLLLGSFPLNAGIEDDLNDPQWETLIKARLKDLKSNQTSENNDVFLQTLRATGALQSLKSLKTRGYLGSKNEFKLTWKKYINKYEEAQKEINLINSSTRSVPQQVHQIPEINGRTQGENRPQRSHLPSILHLLVSNEITPQQHLNNTSTTKITQPHANEPSFLGSLYDNSGLEQPTPSNQARSSSTIPSFSSFDDHQDLDLMEDTRPSTHLALDKTLANLSSETHTQLSQTGVSKNNPIFLGEKENDNLIIEASKNSYLAYKWMSIQGLTVETIQEKCGLGKKTVLRGLSQIRAAEKKFNISDETYHQAFLNYISRKNILINKDPVLNAIKNAGAVRRNFSQEASLVVPSAANPTPHLRAIAPAPSFLGSLYDNSGVGRTYHHNTQSNQGGSSSTISSFSSSDDHQHLDPMEDPVPSTPMEDPRPSTPLALDETLGNLSSNTHTQLSQTRVSKNNPIFLGEKENDNSISRTVEKSKNYKRSRNSDLAMRWMEIQGLALEEIAKITGTKLKSVKIEISHAHNLEKAGNVPNEYYFKAFQKYFNRTTARKLILQENSRLQEILKRGAMQIESSNTPSNETASRSTTPNSPLFLFNENDGNEKDDGMITESSTPIESSVSSASEYEVKSAEGTTSKKRKRPLLEKKAKTINPLRNDQKALMYLLSHLENEDKEQLADFLGTTAYSLKSTITSGRRFAFAEAINKPKGLEEASDALKSYLRKKFKGKFDGSRPEGDLSGKIYDIYHGTSKPVSEMLSSLENAVDDMQKTIYLNTMDMALRWINIQNNEIKIDEVMGYTFRTVRDVISKAKSAEKEAPISDEAYYDAFKRHFYGNLKYNKILETHSALKEILDRGPVRIEATRSTSEEPQAKRTRTED